MKLASTLALTAIAALGLAQSAPAPDRQAAIWAAADDRIATQLEAWFRDGEYPRAIQLIRLQVEIDPHDYDTATNLGWMYENVEDYERALKAYERYRRDNPNDPDSSLPIATMYMMKRNFPMVIKTVEPIINRKGLHPNHYRMLATSYERLNRFKESIAIWKKYLAIAPTDRQAKANLDRVQKKLAAKN